MLEALACLKIKGILDLKAKPIIIVIHGSLVNEDFSSYEAQQAVAPALPQGSVDLLHLGRWRPTQGLFLSVFGFWLLLFFK